MRAIVIMAWMMVMIFVSGCWLTLLYIVEALKLAVYAVLFVSTAITAVFFYRRDWRDRYAVDFQKRKRAYQEGYHSKAAKALVGGGELDAQEDRG